MNHKNQRVTLYVRVSTDGLSVENQTRELQAIAEGTGGSSSACSAIPACPA
jgi:DNA invertase Pin-like site-specific DNA recombinase